MDHLRAADAKLIALLNGSQVLIHPFIVGELACGNIRNRTEILTLLNDLPRSAPATDLEVLFFIERHALMGRGIGYIDAHLLAAVTLGDATKIWTRDKRLKAVAEALELAYGND